MTRREVRENSAIFRTYDQLFPGVPGTHRPPDRTASPHLFSAFLDPDKSVVVDAETNRKADSVSLAFDLKVLVPDYEVDGLLFMSRHYEGGYVFRDCIVVEAFPDRNAPGGWRIMYGSQDVNPGLATRRAATTPLDGEAGLQFSIPIHQSAGPGLTGALRIEARPWT
jgi:hypothetical protein